MRALKLLVVFLGVLLVAGIIALGVGVSYRINHPRLAAAVSPAAPAIDTIALPAGAKVIGSEISGDRVVTRVVLADGGEELLLTNLANGATVAMIVLRPEAGHP